MDVGYVVQSDQFDLEPSCLRFLFGLDQNMTTGSTSLGSLDTQEYPLRRQIGCLSWHIVVYLIQSLLHCSDSIQSIHAPYFV